jgi:hypothetical protein
LPYTTSSLITFECDFHRAKRCRDALQSTLLFKARSSRSQVFQFLDSEVAKALNHAPKISFHPGFYKGIDGFAKQRMTSPCRRSKTVSCSNIPVVFYSRHRRQIHVVSTSDIASQHVTLFVSFVPSCVSNVTGVQCFDYSCSMFRSLRQMPYNGVRLRVRYL